MSAKHICFAFDSSNSEYSELNEMPPNQMNPVITQMNNSCDRLNNIMKNGLYRHLHGFGRFSPSDKQVENNKSHLNFAVYPKNP